MKKQEAIQEQIDEIMDTFDFDRVHEMMKAVDWKWRTDGEDAVPDKYELRREARKLLKGLFKNSLTGTGGFYATKTEGEDVDGPWVWLNLVWGVSCDNDGQTYSKEEK